jgi:hypothetical protein
MHYSDVPVEEVVGKVVLDDGVGRLDLVGALEQPHPLDQPILRVRVDLHHRQPNHGPRAVWVDVQRPL